MPDGLALALSTPGLAWVACLSLVAGMVYGFAGFGSALIFMPLATIILPPPLAMVALSISALGSLVAVFPGAWTVADKGQTLLMLAVSLMSMPLGIALLRLAPEVAIRAAVCGLTLVTLAALVVGWKVPLRGGQGLRIGVGALAGISGGSTGLNGPPVILFNLGTDQPVAVTRGNLASFLTLNALFLTPMMWLQGLVDGPALWLGLVLLGPYALGGFIGVRLFRPEAAFLYRSIAYILIGVAGVTGLPIWGG